MTHLICPGFTPLFAEGPTELITDAIYDQVHPDQDYGLEHSVYTDQMDGMAILNQLSGGKLGLRELSALYAGPDPNRNTAGLILTAQKELCAPLVFQTNMSVNKVLAYGHTIAGADVGRVGHYLMLKPLKIIEDVYFDKEGKWIDHDASSFLKRLCSSEILSRHERADVSNTFEIALQALQAKARWDQEDERHRENA